jgi:hypothetical protein
MEQLSNREAERLRIKADQTSRLMHDALSRFVRVVQGAPDIPQELANDPLLAACELLGRRLDVTISRTEAQQRPAARRRRSTGGNRRCIGGTHAVSRIEGRLVARRQWASSCASRETRTPVALLPHKNHRYELHDPSRGEIKVVSPEVAESLAPFATQF